MPELKEYQRAALDALSGYLRECTRSNDPDLSFYALTKQQHGQGLPYRSVPGLTGMPYVCIRVPTGGGKTVMASHAVGIATRELLRADRSVVLWLVPSHAIREQTLKALRDPRHFYRQALQQELGGPVTVLDVGEALYLSRSAADASTVVIVSTMQAFRVDDTEGRKVYESNGALMDHFTALPQAIAGDLETQNGGQVVYSLANVLRSRQPVVIVDEAHNARTELSFTTLARFNPACILEFTATPDTKANPSNVLYTVSAAELKAEEMIKLPIQLTTRAAWQELLTDAIAARNRLEEVARLERQETGEFIRPIMLLQAQPTYSDRPSLTVETVRDALIKDHRIPAEQVKEATGNNNELYAIPDILAEDCPVRYVITVQALREGWDCPFAYVLCSVAELHSPTAVEQILGRVLRMPKAQRKQRAELNRAYAFVTSARFSDTLNDLRDILVERNGFERQEVGDMIAAALTAVPEQMQPPLYPPDGSALEPLIAAADRPLSPSEQGKHFDVPQLAVQLDGLLEPFEETHFRDEAWSLKYKDASLTEAEFSSRRTEGQTGAIDISKQGEVQINFLEALRERQKLLSVDRWTVGELILWLTRNIRHDDLETDDFSRFLQRLIRSLMDERKLTLEYLAHNKLALRDAAEKKVEAYRKTAYGESYQLFLLPECATPLTVSPEVCFSYDPDGYPYNTLYRGSYQFKKHYYPHVGDLASEGEEFRCAQFIDQMPEVEFWVRNIERRSQSFSLQTSTDRFYPDFVCKLKDGRTLIVEYKGQHLWSGADAKEKRDLGQLWAARSGGTCLFIMPNGPDFESIRALARAPKSK